MDSHFHKNDRESNEIATLSSKAMTEVEVGMTNVGAYCNTAITHNVYL
jgi:hypothetical protein